MVSMVARIWKGRVPREKAAAYRAFLNARAIPDYRSVPGNLAVYVMEREVGDAVEFVTLTFWESLEAIRAFAGREVDRAKYYPEDEDFLLEFPERVLHYGVVGRAP